MWKALLAEFLEKCSYINCEDGKITYPSPSYTSGPKCWQCNGTGQVLTEAGKEFLKFVKDYGDFAESDHSHYIS